MTATLQFPDSDYDIQMRRALERKKLAQQLIEQAAQANGGSGYHGGPVYMVGNQYGNLAKNLGGAAMNYMADKDLAQSVKDRMDTQQDWQNQFNAAPTSGEQAGPMPDGTSMPNLPVKTKRELLSDARNRGLRFDLEQSFMKADEDKDFRAEQATQAQLARSADVAAAAAARAQERQDQRDWQEGQNKLYRRTAEQMAAAAGRGGSTAAAPFAGAATQAGVDPRDDMPVYRISKTGELFKYGENGPVAHTGAVAQKPPAEKASTESERASAGYLGRMQAANKNLAGAEPFPFAVQQGLDRAPNATNYMMTPKQQVQRQQQEDWVRAKLRKESGAVIGDQEMAREIRTYFPMAGDSPEVRASKEQSRAQAEQQMLSSAGKVKPTIAPPVNPVERKTINGKTYEKRGGQWYPL